MLSKSSLQTPVRLLYVSACVNEIAPNTWTNFFKCWNPIFIFTLVGNQQVVKDLNDYPEIAIAE